MAISNIGVLAVLYLSQGSGSELFYSNGGGDPLQDLLEGAMGQPAACQLWFHFEEEIKAISAKYGK